MANRNLDTILSNKPTFFFAAINRLQIPRTTDNPRSRLILLLEELQPDHARAVTRLAREGLRENWRRFATLPRI